MNKEHLSEVVLLTKSYVLEDFKDWLHWHLDIIGFDHCKVFDNESLVDIKSVCESYGDKVDYELVTGWPNQYSLYNRYINNESKAWWVLPIDDDEFLYVSDKYHNKVNDILLNGLDTEKHKLKLAVGWRNLFPKEYTVHRVHPNLIMNATGWSDEASSIWQVGNRPVKTFVKTSNKFEWSDRIGHSTHDPLVNGNYDPAFTINRKQVSNSWQATPTESDADMILYHYQFKSDTEWQYKCAKRTSPGSKTFFKNFPAVYQHLYKTGHAIKDDTRMKDLLTHDST